MFIYNTNLWKNYTRLRKDITVKDWDIKDWLNLFDRMER